MIKGRQSKKGNAYENRIAKLFTVVYYPNGEGEFRRAPKSGGWDKRVVPGDLVALRYVKKDDGVSSAEVNSKDEMEIDKTFRFSIECKDWKDENVKHFVSGLYSADSAFFGWMEQAAEDASYSNKKMPIVIFKLFGTKNIVEILDTDFRRLTELFGDFGAKMMKLKKIGPRHGDCFTLVYALLDDFLTWIDWEAYRTYEYIRL